MSRIGLQVSIVSLADDQSSRQTSQILESCLCGCQRSLQHHRRVEVGVDHGGSQESEDAEQPFLAASGGDSGFRLSL